MNDKHPQSQAQEFTPVEELKAAIILGTLQDMNKDLPPVIQNPTRLRKYTNEVIVKPSSTRCVIL